MQTITLGKVELTRVLEWQGPFAPAATILPDAAPESWEQFAPDFWQDGMFTVALQTWVLRSEGRTILVDTGIGDVQFPQETRPRDMLPALLAGVGIGPDDVDVVVNTHLHYDHVGWNRRPRGRPRTDVPARDLPHPGGGRVGPPDVHGGRSDVLRGHRGSDRRGGSGAVVGRGAPDRREPHAGDGTRAHSRILGAATGVRRRPRRVRGRPAAQPGADRAPGAPQLLRRGPRRSTAIPDPDAGQSCRRACAGDPRALRGRRCGRGAPRR